MSRILPLRMPIMIDTFQKLFLAGLGATATTAEAVRNTLDELVDKGKITRDEAREYADKMMAEGKKEFENSKSEANAYFKSMINRFNVATQDDLQALKKELAALEARLDAQESGKQKKAAKKST